MAVIVPGKFVYLATPHTASMATAKALIEQLPRCWEMLSPTGGHKYGHHHAMREELQIVGDEIVWSVRREPRDVLVTCWLRYAGILRSKKTLEEFVRDWDHAPFIVDGRFDWQDVDEWVEYEDLDAGVNALLGRLGMSPVAIPRTNVTFEKGPWETYWTDGAEAEFKTRFVKS